MPYLLFLKMRQNLKLSSAANYRWRSMGLSLMSSRCTSAPRDSSSLSVHLWTKLAQHALSAEVSIVLSPVQCVYSRLNLVDWWQ